MSTDSPDADAIDRSGPASWHWALIAALITVYGVVAWVVRSPRTFIPTDDALYVLLSRSLRQLSYREWWVVGAPIHANYPPGYPLSLSLAGGLFGESWRAFLAFNAILAAASLGLLFDAARRIWTPWVASGVVVVVAVNPTFVRWTSQFVIAEAQFTFLALLAVWLLLVFTDRSRSPLVVGMAVAILAALTRSVGISIVAALGLALLLEGRWKAAIAFGVAAAGTVGAWLAWSISAGAPVVGRSYGADLTLNTGGQSALVVLGGRAIENALTYTTRIVPSVLNLPTVAGTVIDNALWMMAVLGFSFVGLLVLLQRWRVAALYIVGYAGVLVLWPWTIPRFVVPLLPLLALVFVGGSWEVLRRAVPRFAPVATAGLVLVLMGNSLASLARSRGCGEADPSALACQPQNRLDYAAMARFVRDSLATPGAIMASRPHSFALQSGREVVPGFRAMADDPGGFEQQLLRLGAPLVLLSTVHPDDRQLSTVLQAACGSFRVRRAVSPTTLLLELRTPEEGGEDACRAMEAYSNEASIFGWLSYPKRPDLSGTAS